MLTLTQLIILLAVVAGLVVALDLNRRAQAGRLVGVGQEALEAEIAAEQTRQVALQATREYVESEEYVASYARQEGGLLLPGERRVVPLIARPTAGPTPAPPPTPDPAASARPWHVWWQLLTDAPMPAP
ncbi:MAG: hypothetical protein ACRDHL_13115 [Candidatus Promineifilaceae bacterium]